MLAGHFGFAAAVKSREPQVPLWALMLSTQLLDVFFVAGANDFQIAQNVLSAVSIFDISGVTGVVSAYTQPICQEITPFPNLSQTYAPPVSK